MQFGLEGGGGEGEQDRKKQIKKTMVETFQNEWKMLSHKPKKLSKSQTKHSTNSPPLSPALSLSPSPLIRIKTNF